MKNVLFWMQLLMACIALVFCGVGMYAVDEWLMHDWQSIAPQKISLLSGLMGAFGVLFLAWMFTKLAEPMFEDMRNHDPDFVCGCDEGGACFDSPIKKPR